MTLEVKDLITGGIYLITFGGSLGAVTTKFKGLSSRVVTLEKCLTTEDKEPRFMSYKAHDKICGRQQDTLAEIKDHQEKMDEKIEEILVAVIRLEARSQQRREDYPRK